MVMTNWGGIAPVRMFVTSASPLLVLQDTNWFTNRYGGVHGGDTDEVLAKLHPTALLP